MFFGNEINVIGDGTGSGPSRGVWADFNALEPDRYTLLGDDFRSFLTQASTSVVGMYVTYLDGSCTCSQRASKANGEMSLYVHSTGDVEGAITLANSNTCAVIDSTAGSNKKMWFEASVELSAVTSISAMVGLCQANAPANSLLADDGTGYDKSFVGFRILEEDSDGWDAVYMTSSGSEAVVKESAQDAVASTAYKLGIRFDGQKVYYYVNGVCVYPDGTDPDTSGFPDDVHFAPLFALKDHASAAKYMYVDWWYCGMER